MTENSTIKSLREEKEKIGKQIRVLEEDLEAINRIIMRFSGHQKEGGQIEISQMVGGSANLQPVGPTQALRDLFERYPERKWFPGQIRDMLNTMRNSGVLNSDSKDFLTTTHWILKRFVDDKFVEKINTGSRKACYRKV